MATFRCARRRGLAGSRARRFSAGGRDRLGRVSKAGQVSIGRPLVIGAMARVSWAGRRPPGPGSWLGRMLARKPRMLVAVALANRLARRIWAMLTQGESYRVPALAVAA